jgi:hypothetical protein
VTEREVLAQAITDALSAVDAIADPLQGYREAAELTRLLGEASNHAASIRAHCAIRIKDTERLSLAGLGARLGVSKARADQFAQAVKKAAIERGGSV